MTASDIELAVIRELLAEPRWSRSGLKVKLERFTPEEVDGVIATLTIAGLAQFDGIAVQAAPSIRYLHERSMLRDPTPPNGTPDQETIDRIVSRSAAERALGKCDTPV